MTPGLRGHFSALTLATILTMTGALAGSGRADEREKAAPETGPIPKGLSWTDVGPTDRLRIMEMLAAQTRGNYEKIKTWKCAYEYTARQYLSAKYVSDAFTGESAPKEKVGALMQEFDCDFKFACDMSSGSFFLDKTTRRMGFVKAGTHEVVRIPNVGPNDHRSIVTPERFIHFDPKQTGTTGVIEHPDVEGKRSAGIDPREMAERQTHGDMPDPRTFFKIDPSSNFWRLLEMLAPDLKQHNQRVEEGVIVSQAQGPGGTWYRFRERFSGPDGSGVAWMTMIWSPRAGFNPVYRVMAEKQPDGKPESKTEWQWTVIDGIYIPSMVKESSFNAPDRTLSYERVCTLKYCALNKPLDAHQFDYEALGMKDGELVLNNIERVVYKLNDGGLVKLGDYGDRFELKDGKLVKRSK
jgi:hypothetical protein